jgi:hypothetical protein
MIAPGFGEVFLVVVGEANAEGKQSQRMPP